MKVRKKRLLFLSFSILILVGLCIGVFADSTYYDERLGSVVGSKPFDLGTKVNDVTTYGISLTPGYYILEFKYNNLPSDDITIFTLNGNSDYYLYLADSDVFKIYYTYADYLNYSASVGSTFYIYCFYEYNSSLVLNEWNSTNNYVSVSVYNISEFTTIDVYQNSQDVWTNIVSTISEGTNTILDNDILLLFAAALPIISLGVGFLIRLLHKS